MAVDVNTLTLGEKKKFEEMTGRTLVDLAQNPGALGGPEAVAVLIWLFERRHNPDYPLVEAENFTEQAAIDYLGWSAPEPDEDSEAGKEEGSPKKPQTRKRSS
ncbi:hypothetical protein LQ938_09575 [Microbacterium sp. cx-55]|uniref:hypothetical protein n=1 Tax=Microbacterium sp. cx-55 TaxID=2875948 RepID=UPI001CBBA158|nr:hypothetical protein [Microbacterium sp. cx-55]MBZ4485988.1 hypothetical protein [Microbacterium sp. cx-55]UGB34138.1 hypothetical protein LQ938_09575 [Microbacterium sp. cx-55]